VSAARRGTTRARPQHGAGLLAPRWLLGLASAVFAVALAGCSSPSTAPGSAPANREDEARAQARCLNDKGWDVAVGEDFGVSWEGPSAQIEQFQAAVQECRELVGTSVPQRKLSDEMLRTAYGMQLDTLECLRREGYQGFSEPPTLQAYIDGRGQWTPYSELPLDISEPDWRHILEVCPQPQL